MNETNNITSILFFNRKPITVAFIYRKCSRAGLAGANKNTNSYRKFLTIEITL